MILDPQPLKVEEFASKSIIRSKNRKILAPGIEDFAYRDLYEPSELARLHARFLDDLRSEDEQLQTRWVQYASKPASLKPEEISALLVQMAPYVGKFVAKLFRVGDDRQKQMDVAERDRALFDFRREFLTRRVTKKYKDLIALKAAPSIASLSEFAAWLEKALPTEGDSELQFARRALRLLASEKSPDPALIQVIRKGAFPGALTTALGGLQDDASLIKNVIEVLEAWCGMLIHDETLHTKVKAWASFRLPHNLDYQNLVEIIRPESLLPEKFLGPETTYRRRDGFKLTDERMSERQVLGETEYCIYCHERDKDSCSKGLHEKDGSVKKNPIGIALAGCPLDEKIGEMHVLRNHGDAIGALALIMIDNPMCPGTGHRICNDCMKGCIYQKQTPVNIPEAETGVLTDVLDMPWGFEIYSFLTRWNPLHVVRPYALPYNGKNVLVVGLGPAGYTLSHYLLNEGFGVIGIDGLKIEPLAKADTGYISEDGIWIEPQPVERWRDLYQPLDERSLDGFGGVAEYGITVRWDKNFLTTIYLTLARRNTFSIYGGVRFGGTITIEDAYERYGFDHIAIATGAGKPTIVPMKNNLIRGIRKASDFLMALQLTGAQKRETMANLQVQLPAVVIGGGLTAIDTATELMAYYPVQVEKLTKRWEAMKSTKTEAEMLSLLNVEDKVTLNIFLEHGRAIKAERARASAAGERPNFIPLLRGWGGVTIVYRKSLVDSPAYRLNHEEVEKSLEEGVYYVENMSPVEALAGETGSVSAVRFERQKQNEGKWRATGEFIELPARSVCVAAGTSPNTIYEREHPGTFKMDDWNDFFRAYALTGDETLTEDRSLPRFFTSYQKDGKYISYYGDNHPSYAGNVVKAMASAKFGYPEVVRAVFGTSTERPVGDFANWVNLRATMDENLLAEVVRVDRLTSTIVEVVVKAPAAARHFEPGQFYRLQNFEKLTRHSEQTMLMMEGLALTGAWVDKEEGLLSLIVLEMGSSSRLCAALKPGEPVIVMGPTGAPTEIPENQNVLLAGGGLGNAVLFSIAKAMKERNNNVIYFAGYKKGEDLFKREEIEAATDQVIWSTDSGDAISPGRPQDAHIRANIIEAMIAYQKGELGVPTLFPLQTVNRLIAIGSDRMMAAVKAARRPGGMLYEYMHKDHVAIGSINSPMQCMMKEVCAQCLQKHLDPVTQEEKTFVFSCFNQDQHLDEVDFHHLNERLKANSLEEKLSLLWFQHVLSKEPLEMV